MAEADFPTIAKYSMYGQRGPQDRSAAWSLQTIWTGSGMGGEFLLVVVFSCPTVYLAYSGARSIPHQAAAAGAGAAGRWFVTAFLTIQYILNDARVL